MADNILREPDNPKYRSFKRENDTIKRRLIQPKGALEYALAVSLLACIIALGRPSLWSYCNNVTCPSCSSVRL
jgi:hypothetical protein